MTKENENARKVNAAQSDSDFVASRSSELDSSVAAAVVAASVGSFL